MDFLKGVISDELYGQLSDALKDKGIKLANLATGEYVNKDKFLATENEKKALLAQIGQRDAELEALKKVDVNGLQDKIKELQTQHVKDAEDHQAQIKAMEWKSNADVALAGAHAFDIEQARKLLDKEKDPAEQIAELKKKFPVLFGQTGSSSQGANPPNGDENAKDVLKRDYDAAVKRGDHVSAFAILDKLKKMK